MRASTSPSKGATRVRISDWSVVDCGDGSPWANVSEWARANAASRSRAESASSWTVFAERALKPRDTFRECASDCPEMIVLPAGEFKMGSEATEKGHYNNESPQHKVTIGHPFCRC